MSLVVYGPNSAPVAVDDRATTTQGTSVTIDVLANDSDADGGSVTYTAGFGFIGHDSFTYAVANDLKLEAQAQVTVTVNGEGEPFSDGTFFTDGTG